MQNLFAFGQCAEANYNIGLDEIDEAFKPDLNSMEAQNHKLLDADKKQSRRVFAHKLRDAELDDSEAISKEAQAAANDAHRNYLFNHKRDFEHFSKQMVLDAESLVDRFLEVVSLVIAWADYSKVESDKRSKLNPEKVLVGDFNFSRNSVVNFFRESSKVQVALVKKDISWEDDEDNIKSWFKDVVKKDDEYDKYRRLAKPSFVDDKNIVDHLIKQLVFKNEMILSIFESRDIFWIENKAIVRSLVTRSIRDLEGSSVPKEFTLPDFSNNWEEDKVFFNLVFEATVENDKEYSQMIAAKTKNWEVDRLAITDQIILKMAIAELLNFQSIPVKVTINEYIELSKNYSTPKSKQFVNGILDVISDDLKESGKLKKSGRGLLDNK